MMDFKFKAMDCRLCANKATCSDYEDPTMNPGLLSKACSEFKPMAPEIKTNGDRIRAMNDTELAYFMAGKLTDLYSTQRHDEGKPLTATYISLMRETWFRVLMQYLRMPAEGSTRIETNMYDKEETFPDCTVQVLTNTVTGETSVGWWKNEV